MNDMTYLSGTGRVKTWLDGAVLHVRFNNPEKHNALSVDMWEALPPLLGKAAKDDAVRVVVFSGEGFSPNMVAFLISSGKAVELPDLRAWLALYFGLPEA